MQMFQGRMPDDVVVKLEKRGGEPAKITIEQDGKEALEFTMANLAEVPPPYRSFVHRLVAAADFGTNNQHVNAAERHYLEAVAQLNRVAALGPGQQASLEQRLDQLAQKIDQLRDEVRKSAGD